MFWAQHLGCCGQNTSRIQNKEVYAALFLQVALSGITASTADTATGKQPSTTAGDSKHWTATVPTTIPTQTVVGNRGVGTAPPKLGTSTMSAPRPYYPSTRSTPRSANTTRAAPASSGSSEGGATRTDNTAIVVAIAVAGTLLVLVVAFGLYKRCTGTGAEQASVMVATSFAKSAPPRTHAPAAPARVSGGVPGSDAVHLATTMANPAFDILTAPLPPPPRGHGQGMGPSHRGHAAHTPGAGATPTPASLAQPMVRYHTYGLPPLSCM